MAKETKSTGTTRNGAAQTVAGKPDGNKDLRFAPRTDSPQAVAPPGKRKGGRKREDGLATGSLEAIKADKEKDRLRKQEERALADPPALPSASQASNGSGDTPSDLQTPGLPDPASQALPWQADAISGVVDELIEAAEQGRVASYVARCAEAGLGPKLAREIEADARFPKTAKVLLKQAIPRLIAKWLNKAGLSAEWQDEISVLTALILIVKHNWSVSTRFDKLIEGQNPKPAVPEKMSANGEIPIRHAG